MPQAQSRDEPEVVVNQEMMTNLDSASDTEAAKLMKEKLEEIKMSEARDVVLKNGEESTIFTKDNALKVGGGVLAGVALKVAYDHLTDDGGSAASELVSGFDNLM